MIPTSLPLAIVREVMPHFQGPTAWLIASGRAWSCSHRSVVHRHVFARLACVTAVATAAIEAVLHFGLMLATIPFIGVKRVIWMGLIGLSMLGDGIFWLIHRDALDISAATWIKRIVIHVILFGRVPGVVFNHLKVWAGLMRDHLILVRKITAAALKVDSYLNRFFSQDHLVHHGNQLTNLSMYTLTGLYFAVMDPQAAASRAEEAGLGPASLPSIWARTWAQVPSPLYIGGRVVEKALLLVGDHFGKVALAFLAYSAYRDYSEQVAALKLNLRGSSGGSMDDTPLGYGPVDWSLGIPGRVGDWMFDGVRGTIRRFWSLFPFGCLDSDGVDLLREQIDAQREELILAQQQLAKLQERMPPD